MTRRIGKFLLIEPEKPGQCATCGDMAELRPYGPNGSKICFPCGMLNPAETERQYTKRLKGI